MAQWLKRAAGSCDAAVAGLAREKGAGVNTRENGGESALITASFEECCNVVTALLARRTDVHAGDERGYTALMAAVIGGPIEALRVKRGHSSF